MVALIDQRLTLSCDTSTLINPFSQTGVGQRPHRRWVELWNGEIRYFEGETGGVGKSQKGEIDLAGLTCTTSGRVLTLKTKSVFFLFFFSLLFPISTHDPHGRVMRCDATVSRVAV